MYDPSPFLCPDWISILELAREAISKGECFSVQRASLALSVTNRALSVA